MRFVTCNQRRWVFLLPSFLLAVVLLVAVPATSPAAAQGGAVTPEPYAVSSSGSVTLPDGSTANVSYTRLTAFDHIVRQTISDPTGRGMKTQVTHFTLVGGVMTAGDSVVIGFTNP